MIVVAASCGPVCPPSPKHFVVVVRNTSTSIERVRITWGIGGIYVGTSERLVPPGQDGVFVLGEAGPDLVEIDSTSVKTAFGPPDWNGKFIFGIEFPTGRTWTE